MERTRQRHVHTCGGLSNLQRLVIRALKSQTSIHLPRLPPNMNLSCVKRELHRRIVRSASNSMERSQSRRQRSVNRIWPWKRWNLLWPATIPTKNQQPNRSHKHQEQTIGSRAPKKLEITQDVLWSGDIICQRLDETLPGFYISWVYISAPVVVVILISCSSRASIVDVWLYDVHARADCRRAAVGALL